jgi:hypothetical protein
MQRDLFVVALAIAGFATTEIMIAGFEPLGRARAGAHMLPAIQAELKADTKIYAVGTYEQSMTFYLRRPAVLVDYTDEFAFGLQQQPELGIRPSLHSSNNGRATPPPACATWRSSAPIFTPTSNRKACRCAWWPKTAAAP